MDREKVFDVKGVKPYLLRYGLVLVPALLTAFGSNMKQILLILGGGLAVSGVIHIILSVIQDPLLLSTMWTVKRAKLQTNKRAKSEKDKQRQIEARRREAIATAKREGIMLGITLTFVGLLLMIIALIKYR